MYEPKTPEQIVILKKLEKMLGGMTALDSHLFVDCTLYDLTAKRKLLVNKEVPFGALLL